MSFIRSTTRLLPVALSVTLSLALQSTVVAAQNSRTTDPRASLKGGVSDAQQAIKNLELVSNTPKAAGWFNPKDLGDFGFANSDLAFQKNIVFQGGWHGWQAWDITDPKAPTRRAAVVCQGGQGDPSVYGHLLFLSVEDDSGRLDCGTQGVSDTVSATRFMGVRIFDISNLDAPKQIAAVQTCRGSHTHTLVTDPKDTANVYLYVQGTGGVRSPNELAGCVRSPDDTSTALFRIEVIKVPLATPQNAKVVNMPRIFADGSGKVAGLWKGGDHGRGTQNSGRTDQCHDITAYPEIGLAAGACSGNGILLDITNPANPKRIDEVIDPNFAYWHSATFSNDGHTVLFTDEWGGGTQARCRASDRPTWGADAIFTLGADRKLKAAGYYKLPAAQGNTENCVAHNGSLIPVPGRDIMVQAWYQGGMSVFDFTNPAKPQELAYFDRGPIDSTRLTLAGYWSVYWYNGQLIGSEIARGLDIFTLQPSELLSKNEIDAAKLITRDEFNAQLQTRIVWPAHFSVARAYVDQLERGNALAEARIAAIRGALESAERASGAARRTALIALVASLAQDATASSDATKVRLLSGVVRELAK
ncbi:LVIVD repeat-containing protein [Gemmatimonas sp.]|uniref:LVIVD repeat-containing protein n=1 Tax=Gemmatimonas sp. TaxID=1962908 RepID=UPI0039831BBA